MRRFALLFGAFIICIGDLQGLSDVLFYWLCIDLLIEVKETGIICSQKLILVYLFDFDGLLILTYQLAD